MKKRHTHTHREKSAATCCVLCWTTVGVFSKWGNSWGQRRKSSRELAAVSCLPLSLFLSHAGSKYTPWFNHGIDILSQPAQRFATYNNLWHVQIACSLAMIQRPDCFTYGNIGQVWVSTSVDERLKRQMSRGPWVRVSRQELWQRFKFCFWVMFWND